MSGKHLLFVVARATPWSGLVAVLALSAACASPNPVVGDGGRRPDSGASSADAGTGGSGDDAGGQACDTIVATIRDFQSSHPDMERDESGSRVERGMVADMLGADGKPVFVRSDRVESAATFDQWYRDVDGVNQAFEVPLPLSQTSPGVFVFEDDDFFPIDGMGFAEEFNGHNFHFTTEIVASFEYRGGERFTFRGDDDVWVFVNGRLALDLGGLHQREEATVDFDAQATDLDIEVGTRYELRVFHAERHTIESNFRIETSIDCFQSGLI